MSTADYSALEAQHLADVQALEASGARLQWWPGSRAADALLGWYVALEPTGGPEDHVQVTGIAFDKTIDGQQFPR